VYQNVFYDRFNNTVHLWDDAIGYKSFRYKKTAYKKSSDGFYFTITGIQVEKVGTWTDQDMQADNVFEYDVNPEMRTLIDLYTNDDNISKNHCTVYLDIEVETDQGLPDIGKADKRINGITLYVQEKDRYYTWILVKDIKENIENDKSRTLFFTNESALLTSFLEAFNDIKPTILTGWNIDFFDIPYLYRRIINVQGYQSGNLLSPIGIVHFNEYRQRFFLAGISCLDYMQLYKKFTYNEESSYSLDSISQKELKRGKVKFNMSLQQLYETDIDLFIKYNINDVELIVELDKKLKFLDLVKGICHKGHVPYEDIFMSSRYLEGAILTFIKRKNLVATNKPTKVMGTRFSGAYVKDPKRGLSKWIFDLDLTSLYPSIIMSLNISPETKFAKIENWNAAEYYKDADKRYEIKIERETQFVDKTFVDNMIKDNIAIASNGACYYPVKDGMPMGIIPEILSKWFDERVEYKNLMKKYGKAQNEKEKYEFYKDLQNITKVMLNSLYGVLGLTSFRFYDRDNAEAVTTTGVQIIQFAEKIGNVFYNNYMKTEDVDYCLASDTDSVFFAVEPYLNKNYSQVTDEEKEKITHDFAEKMQMLINVSYNKFCKKYLNVDKHRFYIKQELIAKSGLWVAKKRYVQWIINNNGVPTDKIEVKGIDVVRSNFPLAYRDFMKAFLTDILKGAEEETITNQILDFRKTLGYLSIEKIAKPTGVKEITKFSNPLDKSFIGYPKGAPAHVKAAINYNSLLKHYKLTNEYQLIGNNTKIKWIYLLENPFGIETVAFLQDSPKEIIDFAKQYNDSLKMFDHELRGKVEDFYDALVWDNPFTVARRAKKYFTF
jgi:DNA polymerase elongation subunit (family B)